MVLNLLFVYLCLITAGSLSGVCWGQSARCRGADAASVRFTFPGGSVWCHHQIRVLWRSVHKLHDRLLGYSSMFHLRSQRQREKMMSLVLFFAGRMCVRHHRSFMSFDPPFLLSDRGIIMTFGSGSNGCLGHGNFNDVTQVHVTLFTS